MSNEWEFFQCQMEGGPASIFLDVGIKTDLPLAGFDKLLNIRLHLKSPREDGLSSSEEYPALCDLEDEIEEVLAQEEVIYAGRITYNKLREYFFYSKDFSSKEVLVQKFVKYNYQFDIAQVDDPKWSGYIDELYPTVDDWQVINDRRVVDNLIKHEDDIEKPRVIDHHANFPTKQNAHFYIEKILDLNFDISSIEEMDDGSFQVEFTREDKPEFPQVSSITLPLGRLARSFEGSYGGWGTYIEKKK